MVRGGAGAVEARLDSVLPASGELPVLPPLLHPSCQLRSTPEKFLNAREIRELRNSVPGSPAAAGILWLSNAKAPPNPAGRTAGFDGPVCCYSWDTRLSSLDTRHSDMPFDMSLVQRGARLRRSPFFDATQRHGAKAYTVYNHMLFPICFADLEEEYWHLINHVTLWDVSVERQVEITGPDAFAFTDMLTPRDLSRCAVGQGKYVVITAEDGGIINDPVLLRLGENHFWLALADSDVLLWARGLALSSGLRVEHHGARRLAAPDPGPEGEGRRADALRRRGHEAALLLVPRDEARRHTGRRDAHRLDRRSRLRDLSARRQPRRRAVGAHHGGRASRTRSGRPAPPTSAASRPASSTGART